jgi:SecD/SecF fusion protein
MQNRTAIWIFTVLLSLACLYRLSFTWVVNSVENDAAERAVKRVKLIESTEGYITIGTDTIDVSSGKGRETAESFYTKKFLLDTSDKPVYPALGFTYQECKDKQINLGLDLQGGMSVTLEVSVPDLVKSMAGNPRQPSFTKPFDAALEEYSAKGGDFIDIFYGKFNEMSKGASLAKFFNRYNKQKFPIDLSNEAVVAILKDQAANAIDQTEQVINTRINKFGVNQPTIQKQAATGRLYIELPGVKEEKRVRSLLQSTANLEFWETYGFNDFAPALQEINDFLKKGIVSVEEISNDTTQISDEVAEVSENTEDKVKDSTSIDDLLGDNIKADDSTDTALENTAKENPWFYYVIPSGQSALDPVIGSVKLSDTAIVNAYLRNERVMQFFPKNLTPMWAAKPRMGQNGKPVDFIELYAIKKTYDNIARLNGEAISNASQELHPITGVVQVSLIFKPDAAVEWGNWTTERVNDFIAITMDDLVFTCPVINEPILNGNCSISGSFTMQEATDVATVLKAGSLPAPAKIVDESIVGPSLGKDNIRKGFYSFLIAILLVLVYMIFYYAKAGVVANIALVANIFFIIGTLASLGAALTLPGIAGIVLTIGMSVDANVLIFERIREEIRQGKGMKLALVDGYKKAYSAILDANITTLLTAVVLAYFGSGPIKGFAVTLIIGIFTSLFSAIFITRLVFSYLVDKKKDISFSTKLTENVLQNTKIKFVEKRKVFYAISGVVILLGLGSIFTKGLDKGIEFTGGRAYKVEFNQAVTVNDVKASLTTAFEGMAPEVKTISNNYTVEVKTKFLYNSQDADANDIVDAKLEEGLKAFGEFRVLDQRQVDSSVSASLMTSSILAIVFSLIIIFAYIAFRFRKWQYGLGALAAMFHDVIIVLSLFSIFWGILPFSLEIDQAFIAAILTVVGYSINDTVIVFDRIREYLEEHRKSGRKDVINYALNSTLSRTINTSMTTFMVLLIIFLFGGESIKGFSFALMVGVVVGTYSSLFIASPLVVDLTKDEAETKK